MCTDQRGVQKQFRGILSYVWSTYFNNSINFIIYIVLQTFSHLILTA